MIFNIGGHGKRISGELDGQSIAKDVKTSTGGNWCWTVKSASSSLFIPSQDMVVDIFLCGGGGAGSIGNNGVYAGGLRAPSRLTSKYPYKSAKYGYAIFGGGGGAGGFLYTLKGYQLIGGERYRLTIGAGGTMNEDGSGGDGETTFISYGGEVIASAAGGQGSPSYETCTQCASYNDKYWIPKNYGSWGGSRGGQCGALCKTASSGTVYYDYFGYAGGSATGTTKYTYTDETEETVKSEETFNPGDWHAFGDSTWGDVIYGAGGGGGHGYLDPASLSETYDTGLKFTAAVPSCCTSGLNGSDKYSKWQRNGGGATGGGRGGGWVFYKCNNESQYLDNCSWSKDTEHQALIETPFLKGADGLANTGGGGGGGGFYAVLEEDTAKAAKLQENEDLSNADGGAGGSGVIIIRNHRETEETA